MRVFGVGLIVVLAAGTVAAAGPSGGQGGYGGGCGSGPCSTPTPTPTATATPTATVTPPPPDTTPPSCTAHARPGQTARSIRKRGFILNVVCSENCRHVTQLFVNRKTARKLGIKPKAKRRVLVGKHTSLLTANVAKDVVVKLSRKAKRGVRRMKRRHVRRLRLTVATAATDAANNTRRASTTLSFRR